MKEKYLDYLKKNIINENFKVIFKEIKSAKDDKTYFITKEKIDIFLYSKDENNSLKNKLSIHLKIKTKINDNPRSGLNKLLSKKIKQQIVNQCDYIHIFIDDIDRHGLLCINDHNKIVEKITNTLITGIPMFKNRN